AQYVHPGQFPEHRYQSRFAKRKSALCQPGWPHQLCFRFELGGYHDPPVSNPWQSNQLGEANRRRNLFPGPVADETAFGAELWFPLAAFGSGAQHQWSLDRTRGFRFLWTLHWSFPTRQAQLEPQPTNQPPTESL